MATKNYVDLTGLTRYDELIKEYISEQPVGSVQSDYAETDTTDPAYIKNKPTLGTAASKDVASSGDASSTQVVMGNDSRLTDNKVTQTEVSTNSNYEILFSGTADNTTRTEGTGKSSKLTYNPTLAALILGSRDANISVGNYSVAEGQDVAANGDWSHAEGRTVVAYGDCSHAEGYLSTTYGHMAHAEGYKTRASGEASHAEGYVTKASSDYQHVEGKYNIEDSSDVYAHIIGNGTADALSNAMTVDWSGNMVLSGDLTVANDVESGNTWDGTNTSLVDAISDTNGAVTQIQTQIGNTTLPTTSQTITGAIDEHDGDINTLNNNLANKHYDIPDDATLSDIYTYVRTNKSCLFACPSAITSLLTKGNLTGISSGLFVYNTLGTVYYVEFQFYNPSGNKSVSGRISNNGTINRVGYTNITAYS